MHAEVTLPDVTSTIKCHTITTNNGKIVFHVTSTMLDFLQIKGLYAGQARENPHNHLNFFY